MHSKNPVCSNTLGSRIRQPTTSRKSLTNDKPLPTSDTSSHVTTSSVTNFTQNHPSHAKRVTSATTHTKNKYPYISPYSRMSGSSQYAFAVQSLLQTVDFNLQDLKDWAILDSGATSHFLITTASVIDILPTTTPLVVQIPNG